MLPKINWLYGNIIPTHGLALLYGSEGTGKSLYGLHLANQVAQDGHTVLYVPVEDLPVIDDRNRAYRKANGITETRELYLMAMEQPILNEEHSVEMFIQLAGQLNPALIFIDTYRQSTRGIDENLVRDVAPTVDAMRKISNELDCCTAVIHHSGKDGSKGARGSSVLPAGYGRVISA